MMNDGPSVELSFDGVPEGISDYVIDAPLPSSAQANGAPVTRSPPTIPEEDPASEAAIVTPKGSKIEIITSMKTVENKNTTDSATTERIASPCDIFKYLYSTYLLIFSTVFIMGLIWYKQTNLSSQSHPAVAYVAIWGGIIWLTMVEGSQGSLVGLAPVNPELYKDSHPITYKCLAITNKGDNLDRYLMGRQCMVCLIVFLINIAGGPIGGAELWGFPSLLKDAIFTSGLCMILFTAMVGQLNSQVNASLCMLDYINNYFALFTLGVAMAIEFSGLLHASYLIQMLVGRLSGQRILSNEEPRHLSQNIFFWLRCLVSLAILSFCTTVTMVALFEKKTTMWKGVHPIAALVIFFILLCVVGMLEGMQIAFFAVSKLPASERGNSKFAKMTCALLFQGEGNNLPGFMIGRQLFVVACMFFVARVTSVSLPEDSENIFGVPDLLQQLFNTGLLGALMLTIVGSIAWQLVASAFPIAFLSNPLTYLFLRICLWLEASGICWGAWVLAAVHKKMRGFQRDEVYIGTAEERRGKDMGDDSKHLHVGPGHPVKLPGFIDHAPNSLKLLVEKDPSIAHYINFLYDNANTNKNDDNTVMSP
eukprot:CAMPEP_0194328232 /NCGR_PEP_ID=MMETSP0171-20130528/43959_1 /TAXON_ID=218684 /ORGANISM="Corethron pennatum, Strain L29A3" /LENGTH=591 /DNA_ID=CAMNT_0039088487 /DNA_START=64 /DNA_END=1839 /DNA_ORIENTATION=-